MKKIIAFTLCVIIFAAIPFNALATTTEGMCRMQYYITDTTNGEFKDEITITLYNKTVDVSYTYKATIVDYTWHYPVGGYVLDGTYIMTIDYFSKDEYTIQNSDGSKLTYLFHTFDDFMDHRWLIVKNNSENDVSSSEVPKEDVTHGEYENSTEDNKYIFNKSEADALFLKFTALISPVLSDEQYEGLFYAVGENGYVADIYAQYTDNTVEDFKNMSLLERYLWWVTYGCGQSNLAVRPIESYDQWKYRVSYIPRALLYENGTEEMVQAYEELMKWSYEYYAETGEVYNFVQVYKSEGNDFSNITAPEASDESDIVSNDIDVTGVVSELESDSGEGSNAEIEVGAEFSKEGIWDDTVDSLKNNAITIIILFVLIGIAAGIFIYRKKITLK